MITFSEVDDQIIFSYTPEFGDENWIIKELDESGSITLKKTFHFVKSDLLTPSPEDIDKADFDNPFNEPEATHFLFATADQDYFKITKGILSNKQEIFIHRDIKLTRHHFIADSNISIFRMLSDLIDKDIYVGGTAQNAIPTSILDGLISSFPNSYEKKRYAEARVSAIIKDYVDGVKDSEAGYRKYMNKKISRRGDDLQKTFKEIELLKYQTILEKVYDMLNNEQKYSESQWQKEILQVILLLYPKYLFAFTGVPIKDKIVRDRILDFLLIDSSGHVDIIEIKQPFDNCVMSENTYRNNYIPMKELSGTIMQLEKYIFFLNRWSSDGEEYLTNKYTSELPKDFKIQITNPSGLIIMGRENNLSTEQKLDFEVVKRKYKNVIDIITYDNLIYRLQVTIEQIKKI